MAIRYAVASGNWSTGSTWDGGTLPTSGDDVYADGKTITIDQSITVANLYTLQRVGGTIGGVFNITASGLTITANIAAAGSASPTGVIITVTGPTTIVGNITGNINTPSNSVGIGLTINSGTVNVIGNVQGGGLGGSNNNGSYGISVLNSAILNLTGNTVGGASSSGTHGIIFSNTSRGVITGNATGGSNAYGILSNSTLSNALVFNGNCIAASLGGVANGSTGTVVINGNQTATGTTGVYCVTNTSTGIITINGNILGALATTPSLAYVVNNSGAGIVNINGSVIQQSIGPSASVGIVNNGSTGTINISGSVAGGSVANSIGVSNASTGTINVTGNITGGTNTTMTPAIYSTTAGIINVTGETVSGLYPALYSTSTTAINRLKGNIKSFNGLLPFVAFKINCDPLSGQTITIQDIGNTDRLFSTSNVSNGAPLPANVRSGIVYGSLNEFTGSTIMATPDNVRKGVLTDNTVGTGQLTAEDFLNAIATGTDPLSIRLQNVSTVQSTGDQISNY